MRSIKLVPTLSAMATLLAVAPAGATAAKPAALKLSHAVHAGSCRVSLNAAPRLVDAGESALVFGQLVCPSNGASVAGQTVTVLQSSAGTAGLTTAGTATTDPGGRYQLNTPALSTNSVFFASVPGAKSGHKAVKVSPRVTLTGPPDGSQLFTGLGPFIHVKGSHQLLPNTVTFKGTVSPIDVGATVVLQREDSVGVEEWRRIGVGIVGAGGNYSIVHKFGVPGEANIRVVVRAPKLNVRGASESLSYEISQAQNPALMIHSSADPISYGQPVTISGTLDLAAATPLTLLAHTRTQTKFVPIATTVSSGGSYTFPVQTPLQSTVYQVVGGGKTSGRLFEGVKYGLTAGVSASTVVQGQSLTFAGTVSPANAGHGVYLQVQDATGFGLHVVQVGSVNADGTYSITYTPFNTRSKQYRIKVPGDPGNQGISSALFPITVTPAPASVLRPEAPGNSSLPAEGHI